MQGIGYKAKKIATQEYNARHTQQGVQCKEYNAMYTKHGIQCRETISLVNCCPHLLFELFV